MMARRRAIRDLIRSYEKLSARLVRALRAEDPERTLRALLELQVFADEGLASYCVGDPCEPYAAAADPGASIAAVGGAVARSADVDVVTSSGRAGGRGVGVSPCPQPNGDRPS